MTYFEPAYQTQTQAEPRPGGVMGLPVVQFLLAGVWFMLGLVRQRGWERFVDYEAFLPIESRQHRRQSEHMQRRAVHPSRNIGALRALLPGGAAASHALTRTQFLERCTRLSSMGRFQIYGFLYYRAEFWRGGAIRLRARAPKDGVGSVLSTSCGLSASHLWPD